MLSDSFCSDVEVLHARHYAMCHVFTTQHNVANFSRSFHRFYFTPRFIFMVSYRKLSIINPRRPIPVRFLYGFYYLNIRFRFLYDT